MNNLGKLTITLLAAWGVCHSASAALQHQYLFNDGTANDTLGTANGTLINGATVSGGAVNLNGSGQYVNLNGPAIGVNTYSALTLELWLNSSSANTGYTMAAMLGRSFNVNIDGASNGGPFPDGDTWRGIAYIMIQPTRGGGPAASRVAITALSFEAESGVNGPGQLNDNLPHYIALTIDSSTISYYLDGGLIGSSPVGANTLASVSSDLAYLGRSNYPDPYFAGSINEFSIWNNVLSANEIAANYLAGPVPVPEPAAFALVGLAFTAITVFRRRA